jgi:hypothetical protein
MLFPSDCIPDEVPTPGAVVPPLPYVVSIAPADNKARASRTSAHTETGESKSSRRLRSLGRETISLCNLVSSDWNDFRSPLIERDIVWLRNQD